MPAAAPADTHAFVMPARDPHLPPAEDQAKAQLDASPRHGEFVDIPHGPGKKIRAWVVYPEQHDQVGIVLLIHEIYGLSDWIRGVADQLADEGFIAIAPDFISGMGPGGGGTDSVASRDGVVKLVMALDKDEMRRRLDDVMRYAAHVPAGNRKVVTMGFCWGGGRSFDYAISPRLSGAIVFYGVPPDTASITRVKAPVIGFYGGDDARVTSTVEFARGMLGMIRQPYDPHIFAGAGHGFLRQQSGRNGANYRATQQAWPLALAFLRTQLK
ncbi:MAG: dienelactone hydrolase family protein [Candidatus Eisenbacteria bacterium]|uniref:Dienelactone hydrolase family protein n=1 Tax=Eiseniibacteriota bacterium TaxID=2212470 RepID=A0A9D6QIA3_UNCEI|nr:dienelactone hydrolase family protein [Candidatus Eisenbacteria bacterium]